MKKTQKTTNWIMLGVVLMTLIFTGALAWDVPLLGKSIQQLNTQIAAAKQAQATETGNLSADQITDLIPLQASTPDIVAPEAVSGAKPVCGAVDQALILALGIDEAAQSDVIRLVKLDYINQKVIVLSIPRDLYLPLPGFEDQGITTGRINSAYGFGEVYSGRGQGVFATANSFAGNFGITFDQYVVGHFSSLVKLVDRVGGVDVTLDQAAIGYGDVLFEAGNHHLNGEQPLSLARVRKADDDHHRIDRQTIILKALMSKIKDSMSVLELTAFGLETINDKEIQTDLSVGDMVTLACFGKGLTPEDISFVNLPAELYRPATSTAGGSIILPREGLVRFVQDVLGVNE